MDGYWFTSTLFAIEPGEDQEVNPGRYGRQLALWLKDKLEERGYNVEPVIAEDWGRCLMLSRRPFLLWVGCGNVDDSLDGQPSGNPITWHCFATAEVPLLKRIFGKPDTGPALSELSGHLHAILSAEAGITLVAAP